MFGHMFHLREQRRFIYTEGFKLLPDFLFVSLVYDICLVLVLELKVRRLAFVSINSIKKKCPGLPYYAWIVKHRFDAKDSFYVF